jgi:uncharacterized protein (TIGR02145 family)
MMKAINDHLKSDQTKFTHKPGIYFLIFRNGILGIFLGLILVLAEKPALAQTDTEFWFAVPKLTQSHDWNRRRFYIRGATLDLPATVTISMPATPGFKPMVVDVPANTAFNIPLLSDLTYDYTNLSAITANGVEEFIFQMWNEFPNQVYNRGLRITANNLITAYFEVGTVNNPDIFSLKGRNALGTDFFVPFQNVHYNQPLATRPYSGIYIVAREDNTIVTITPTRPVFPGRPAGVPFEVILNRGQSYAVAPDDYNDTGRLPENHLGGTRIQSTKPIAVTTSDDSVRGLPGGCYDLIGDQLIPTSIIGKEYIVMKGRLNADINEGFYVTGTQPNTQVYVDGLLVAMIGPGQMYRHTFTQQNHHVRSSESVYVYHIAGFGCEMAGAVLPPVDVCTGSTEVAFTRSKGEYFFLNILVRKGAQDAFYFNGDGPNTVIRASDFHEVPGSADWLAAEFEFNQTFVPIGQARLIKNTKDVFHLAVINGGPTSGAMYGYFSHFNSLNVKASISGTGNAINIFRGESVQLLARGGASYQWHPPDFLNDAFTSNPVATPESTIEYTVTVKGFCNMKDSARVRINVYDPVIPDEPFECGQLLRDIDGNLYPTTKIGGQCWMAENLKVTHYQNGEPLLSGQNAHTWRFSNEGIWEYYDKDQENDPLYGKLYNWYAITDNRGLCPAGWMVPTDEVWDILLDFIDPKAWGNNNNVATKLKSKRQENSPLGEAFRTSDHPRWDSHPTRFGMDEYGFSALPGGLYTQGTAFVHKGHTAYFWSVSEAAPGQAWTRVLLFSHKGISRSQYHKSMGLSVRCLQED